MPRIRTIKPEFWSSPSTAKASPVARLAFIAMWNWADDHGRGTANLKELEGFIFPHDDISELSSGNTVNFRSLVAEIIECFDVVFYEADNRPFYAITTWDEHQRNERRAAESKYPEPTGIPAFPDLVAEIPSHSTVDPNISGTGTGEQGNRGTGEQGKEPLSKTGTKSSGDVPPHFEAFWDAYAHKVGRGQAVVAFKSASKKVDPAVLIEAAAKHADWHERAGTQWKKIPHGSTWLNGERWLDERPEPGAQSRPMSAAEQRMAANAALTMQLRAEQETQQRAIEGNR